jgi:hypothetical protein
MPGGYSLLGELLRTPLKRSSPSGDSRKLAKKVAINTAIE